MIVKEKLAPAALLPAIERVFSLAGPKIRDIDQHYPKNQGAPVFTVAGKYTARGWTEWTQGFQFGAGLLVYDATGDRELLKLAQENTVKYMASHVTHVGVHDHGFNNVSTYGNLLRLLKEGKVSGGQDYRDFLEMALKCSGAIQARRWTRIKNGGYIHSFNGQHSLFSDTIRSLRSLALGHALGHTLMDEQDSKISLLARLVEHAQANADYNVYYGEGRDTWDMRGRVVHESIFNVSNGVYRCASSQQGYSPFTTWTRGQAWVITGYAELLEFLAVLPASEWEAVGGVAKVEAMMLKAARATCDFWIEQTPTDGIPYWDTGAPGLVRLGDFLNRPADPYNAHEPVDSSAACIAAQGLLRLGRYLIGKGEQAAGQRYWQAGLTVAESLFREPYLSTSASHQGLILHSVYHRPNGWDHVPAGQKVPCGESSMWGDYHALELALYLRRVIKGESYLTFFGGLK